MIALFTRQEVKYLVHAGIVVDSANPYFVRAVFMTKQTVAIQRRTIGNQTNSGNTRENNRQSKKKQTHRIR